jgi:hypothetical protein
MPMASQNFHATTAIFAWGLASQDWRLTMHVRPLSYSAFPKALAEPLGVMTVAYQRLEEEVATLFEAVSGTSPEVAGVLLKKLDNTSGRVAVIKEIARVCIPDEVETGRVLDLCGRVTRATGFSERAEVGAARARGLTIERLDLRTSGDTAGPKDRVVGYGAWALYEGKG